MIHRGYDWEVALKPQLSKLKAIACTRVHLLYGLRMKGETQENTGVTTAYRLPGETEHASVGKLRFPTSSVHADDFITDK